MQTNQKRSIYKESLIELLFAAGDVITDVKFGRRFGYCGLLWKAACFVCLFLTGLFFYLDVVVLGVIGIVGTVICFVFSIRCSWRDICRVRKAQAAGTAQETDA